MRFILWTIAWWGMSYLGDVLNFGYPIHDKMHNLYSNGVIATAFLVNFVLYIALYCIFVQEEN